MNDVFISSNGKPYGGTAALLHKIKLEGGYEQFMKNREYAAITEFLDSPISQAIIEERARANSERRKITMESCG